MTEESKVFEEALKQDEVYDVVTEDIVEPICKTENNQEEVSSLSKDKPVPYHERYYLKYRDGKRSAALDLGGTKSFLHEIGFDGGELRKARECKNYAENFNNEDKNKNNQMFCSYCGTVLSGVEFFRLPDGRLRCNTCSNTVVKSKSEVEALCKRIIENM